MSPVAVSVHEFLSYGGGIWRTGYSLPICNSSTCQKSIITSVMSSPPFQPHTSSLFYIENHTNSYFSYQAVFLTLLIIPWLFSELSPGGPPGICCSKVDTIFYLTSASFVPSASQHLCLFVYFLFEDFCPGNCLLFFMSNCRTMYFHYLASSFFLTVFPHFNKIPLNSNNIFWQAQNISEFRCTFLFMNCPFYAIT